jgi:hypothetical protein
MFERVGAGCCFPGFGNGGSGKVGSGPRGSSFLRSGEGARTSMLTKGVQSDGPLWMVSSM